MTLRPIKVTILAASIVMATASFADDFNISNRTKHVLSFKVNGACSEEFGKVDAYSIKNIPEKTFLTGCSANTTPCDIKVYGQDSCRGKVLTKVRYNISNHHTSAHQYASDINMAIKKFDLFLFEPLCTRKK